MSGEQRQDRPEEPTRDYLKSALEHMLAAGRSVSDMVEFSLDRLGDRVIPDVQAFLQQVQRGEVNVKGLSRSTREALFGMKLTPEERATLIREAAYLKAESRGFAGGSPEQDWLDAEREVDALIAREIGLVPRGREALAGVGDAVEREFGDLGRLVTDWLEGRKGPSAGAGPGAETAPSSPPRGEPAPEPAKKGPVAKEPPAAGAKNPVAKKVAKKKAAANKAGERQAEPEKKAAPEKKVVKKAAAKKKVAKKKAAKAAAGSEGSGKKGGGKGAKK
jgi:hypothetical protein